jgi:hypothetical protein
MDLETVTMILIPKEELIMIKSTLEQLLLQMQRLNDSKCSLLKAPPEYLTAIEFMAAVKVGRSKFDQLVSENKIKTIKKRRKIYVPSSEVERHFTDPCIL